MALFLLVLGINFNSLNAYLTINKEANSKAGAFFTIFRTFSKIIGQAGPELIEE